MTSKVRLMNTKRFIIRILNIFQKQNNFCYFKNNKLVVIFDITRVPNFYVNLYLKKGRKQIKRIK